MNLFLLDQITGEHVHFMFVMNFGKFILDICCYFSISFSSLKGEFDVFCYGVFSSYKNMGQCVSLLVPLGNETYGLDICRCKLRTKQNLLLTTELKLKR